VADAAYDVPAAGSDAAGLEGFAVVGAGRRLGRVAALNRRADGLVLVVDTGDDYRALPASAITSIELRPRTVRLRSDAEADAPRVEVRVLRADSPALVRHVPRELDRLLVEGDAPPAASRAGLWVGLALVVVGGVALFVGATVTAEVAARPVVWLWLLVPLALVVAGSILLWRELGAGDGRRLTRRERAGDALTLLLGITPRTRRRG
jgi:hypothetical protein